MFENNYNFKRVINRQKDRKFLEWVEIKGKLKDRGGNLSRPHDRVLT